MNLPRLPAPASIEVGVSTYIDRLKDGAMPFPEASQLLLAYMAWPNDRESRDSWMASNIALVIENQQTARIPDGEHPPRSAPPEGSPNQMALELFGGLGSLAGAARSHLLDRLDGIQQRWLRVADILQMVVDIAHEERVVIAGGASISKAIDLLECHAKLPGRSQLASAWGQFRDVSHLITAAAHLAYCGREQTAEKRASAVLTPVLLVPEAVLELASALQEFGLRLKPFRQITSLLPAETLWRVSPSAAPENLFLPVRRLTDEQMDFLAARRARPKRKPLTSPT